MQNQEPRDYQNFTQERREAGEVKPHSTNKEAAQNFKRNELYPLASI